MHRPEETVEDTHVTEGLQLTSDVCGATRLTTNTFAFTNGRIAPKWKGKEYYVSFGVFLAISQNTLILVSHVPENLMKKLKISPFGKIGKCQNLAKYEK